MFFLSQILDILGARILSLNGYLLVVDVTREDNSISFKCQVHNSLTKELKTSKTSGKLITLGEFHE